MADEEASQTPASEPVQTNGETATVPATEVASETGAALTEPQTAQIPANEPIASATPAPVVVAPAQNTSFARDLLAKAREVIQSRKTKKLERILSAITAKGKITNDEVEKLLHVSDATATRYLSALEKEGKIKQVGKTGKAVEYTRI